MLSTNTTDTYIKKIIKKKQYGYVIKTYQKKEKKRNYVIKYIVKYLHNIFFLNRQILSSRCGLYAKKWT